MDVTIQVKDFQDLNVGFLEDGRVLVEVERPEKEEHFVLLSPQFHAYEFLRRRPIKGLHTRRNYAWDRLIGEEWHEINSAGVWEDRYKKHFRSDE